VREAETEDGALRERTAAAGMTLGVRPHKGNDGQASGSDPSTSRALKRRGSGRDPVLERNGANSASALFPRRHEEKSG
jgi:hypothetical protein